MASKQFAGMHCQAAGLKLSDFSNGNSQRLQPESLTNGIILELYRHSRIRHIADDDLISWIRAILPQGQSLDLARDAIMAKIANLKEKRDFIRKRKGSCLDLEKQPFVFDHHVQDTAVGTDSVLSSHACAAMNPPSPCSPLRTLQSSASAVVNRPSHLATSSEDKENNFLSYTLSVKKKEIVHLESQIASLKSALREQGKINSHYLRKNVDTRQRSKDRTLSHLRIKLKYRNSRIMTLEQTIRTLEQTIREKDNDISALHQEIRKAFNQVKKEQRMKSYYKSQPSSVRKVRFGKEQSYAKLNRYVSVLENRLLEAQEGGQTVVVTKTEDGFTSEMRLTVIGLLGLEVAIHKVSPVIQVVAKHLFGHNFKDAELPSRQTALRISDEGQFLTKLFYTEKIEECSNFGINKDGTSRKKVKMLETSLTLQTGEVLPLGFRRIAKEDSVTVLQNTQKEIAELSDIQNDSDAFKVEALEKLSFFMSDRAATEKKANQLLDTWVQEELAKADVAPTTIHSLYCMAHVLLGFHRYSTEGLNQLQKELIVDGGKLGRDANGAYSFFRAELAPSRLIRMASEILGPNVDEKSGVRDKWLADLAIRHERSLIGDFRDNRFNGLFCVAAQIMYHVDDILSLEKRLKSPNLKVKSVFLDLKDSRLLTMVQAIAIVYIRITEPYWRLVTSKTISYLDLHRYIQPLLQKVEFIIENPGELLQDNEIIPTFAGDIQHPMYATAIEIRHEDRRDLLLRTIVVLMSAFARCIKQQLVDFLDGGKYGANAGEVEKRRTQGSGLHNLTSERNFGSLDASQKRRRHANLHFHTSVLLLKTNRVKLLQWITSKPADERKKILLRAKTHGKWLRTKHIREEAAQKKKEEEDLVATEAELKRKAAKKLVKKANDIKKSKSNKTKKPTKSNTGTEKGPAKKNPKSKKTRTPQKPEPVVDVQVNDWVVVAFNNGWYPGQVLSIDGEKAEIDFMYPTSSKGVFKWPSPRNVERHELKFLCAKIKSDNYPVPVSGGRAYSLQNWKELDTTFKIYKEFYF